MCALISHAVQGVFLNILLGSKEWLDVLLHEVEDLIRVRCQRCECLFVEYLVANDRDQEVLFLDITMHIN